MKSFLCLFAIITLQMRIPETREVKKLAKATQTMIRNSGKEI